MDGMNVGSMWAQIGLDSLSLKKGADEVDQRLSSLDNSVSDRMGKVQNSLSVGFDTSKSEAFSESLNRLQSQMNSVSGSSSTFAEINSSLSDSQDFAYQFVDSVSQVLDSIEEKMGEIRAAVVRSVNEIVESAKEKMVALGASIRSMADEVINVILPVTYQVGVLVATIATSAKTLMNDVVSIATDCSGAIQNTWGLCAAAIVKTGEDIGAAATAIGAQIQAIASTPIDHKLEPLKQMLSTVGSQVSSAGESIYGFFQGVQDKLLALFTASLAAINSLSNGVGVSIKKASVDAEDGIRDIKQAMQVFFTETLGEKFHQAQSKVKEFFTSLKASMTETLSDLKEKVAGLFESMKQNISAAFNAVKDHVKSIGNSIKDAWSNFTTPQVSEVMSTEGLEDRQVMWYNIGRAIAVAATSLVGWYARALLIPPLLTGIATGLGLLIVGFEALKMIKEMFTGEFFTSENLQATSKITEEVTALSKELNTSHAQAQAISDAMLRLGTSKESIIAVTSAVANSLKDNREELDRLGVKYQEFDGRALDTYSVIKNGKEVLDQYTDGWNRNQAAIAMGFGTYSQMNEYLKTMGTELEASKRSLMDYSMLITDYALKGHEDYNRSLREFQNETHLTATAWKKMVADFNEPVMAMMMNWSIFKNGWPTLVATVRDGGAILATAFWGLVDVVDIVWATIKVTFNTGYETIKGIASAIVNVFTGYTHSILDDIKSTWDNIVKAIAEDVVELAQLIERNTAAVGQALGPRWVGLKDSILGVGPTPNPQPEKGANWQGAQSVSAYGEAAKKKSDEEEKAAKAALEYWKWFDSNLAALQRSEGERTLTVAKDMYDKGQLSHKQYLQAKQSLTLTAYRTEMDLQKKQLEELQENLDSAIASLKANPKDNGLLNGVMSASKAVGEVQKNLAGLEAKEAQVLSQTREEMEKNAEEWRNVSVRKIELAKSTANAQIEITKVQLAAQSKANEDAYARGLLTQEAYLAAKQQASEKAAALEVEKAKNSVAVASAQANLPYHSNRAAEVDRHLDAVGRLKTAQAEATAAQIRYQEVIRSNVNETITLNESLVRSYQQILVEALLAEGKIAEAIKIRKDLEASDPKRKQIEINANTPGPGQYLAQQALSAYGAISARKDQEDINRQIKQYADLKATFLEANGEYIKAAELRNQVDLQSMDTVNLMRNAYSGNVQAMAAWLAYLANKEKELADARKKQMDQLAQLTQLQIERQLALVNMQERFYQISHDDAIAKRIALYRQELQIHNQIYESIKEQTPAANILRNQELKIIQDINEKLLEQQKILADRTALGGAVTALHELADEATNIGRQVHDTLQHFFKGLEDNIVSGIMKGKMNWADFVDQVMEDLLRMTLKTLVFGPIEEKLANFTTGLFGNPYKTDLPTDSSTVGTMTVAMANISTAIIENQVNPGEAAKGAGGLLSKLFNIGDGGDGLDLGGDPLGDISSGLGDFGSFTDEFGGDFGNFGGDLGGMGDFGIDMLSAAGGMDIPGGINPIVQAHEKEMILPQEQAEAIRKLSKSPKSGADREQPINQNIHNWNVSAMDSQSFFGYMMENRDAVGAVVSALHAENSGVRRMG